MRGISSVRSYEEKQRIIGLFYLFVHNLRRRSEVPISDFVDCCKYHMSELFKKFPFANWFFEDYV